MQTASLSYIAQRHHEMNSLSSELLSNALVRNVAMFTRPGSSATDCARQGVHAEHGGVLAVWDQIYWCNKLCLRWLQCQQFKTAENCQHFWWYKDFCIAVASLITWLFISSLAQKGTADSEREVKPPVIRMTVGPSAGPIYQKLNNMKGVRHLWA